MKISEVEAKTAKEQKALLRKITALRVKQAKLLAAVSAVGAEIDDARWQLVQLSAENHPWWDGVVDGADRVALECSEMNIPLPTAHAERIVYNAKGRHSSLDGFTPSSYTVDEF